MIKQVIPNRFIRYDLLQIKKRLYYFNEILFAVSLFLELTKSA